MGTQGTMETRDGVFVGELQPDDIIRLSKKHEPRTVQKYEECRHGVCEVTFTDSDKPAELDPDKMVELLYRRHPETNQWDLYRDIAYLCGRVERFWNSDTPKLDAEIHKLGKAITTHELGRELPDQVTKAAR